ncbi:MAG TPA: hypothetical protein VK531_12065 [Gemmatimonadales bacterium]|nr:hypothetical protein [Gemmatimonadales bacterium]
MKRSPAAAPAPVALGSLEQIVAALRALEAEPHKASEKLAAWKLLAALLPDEDHAGLRAALEHLYPAIRGTRDKLKALALAVELLPAESRPKHFGEQVVLEMAGDA